MVKLGQIYFITNDCDLYDRASNKRILCRALNINEDLGQVEYVFSDKTGTLTENRMVFKRCTIGGVDYSGNATGVIGFTSGAVLEGVVGGGTELPVLPPPTPYQKNGAGSGNK